MGKKERKRKRRRQKKMGKKNEKKKQKNRKNGKKEKKNKKKKTKKMGKKNEKKKKLIFYYGLHCAAVHSKRLSPFSFFLIIIINDWEIKRNKLYCRILRKGSQQ